MLVINWNIGNYHPLVTDRSDFCYSQLLIMKKTISFQVRRWEPHLLFTIYIERNFRISQQEKLKSPAVWKWIQLSFPITWGWLNHPRTLEIYHLISTSTFQHKLKRKSRQATRNNRFHHLNLILFDLHALWFSLPESTRYERSTTRQRQLQCYCSSKCKSYNKQKEKWRQRQKDHLFLCMSKAEKEKCIMFLNSRK